MKMKFNLKNKELSLDANVENLIEKELEYKSTKPIQKTKYQIKQEEKRKNEEFKQKQLIQGVLMMLSILVFVLIICIIGSKLGL